jgi:D-arabinose 1-dehydrogenase-like Zn-dependent alcohol dehydrogenase
MTMMKAAVVPELGGRVEIRELPVPEPGPGQVMVRMVASGLCHTDIHAAAGDWPVKSAPPFTPGHEGVGIVEATGPGASLPKSGERVAIAWLGSACGKDESTKAVIDGLRGLELRRFCRPRKDRHSAFPGQWPRRATRRNTARTHAGAGAA